MVVRWNNDPIKCPYGHPRDVCEVSAPGGSGARCRIRSTQTLVLGPDSDPFACTTIEAVNSPELKWGVLAIQLTCSHWAAHLRNHFFELSFLWCEWCANWRHIHRIMNEKEDDSWIHVYPLDREAELLIAGRRISNSEKEVSRKYPPLQTTSEIYGRNNMTGHSGSGRAYRLYGKKL